MLKYLVVVALLLASPAAADQVTPSFGLDSSGSARQLYVRDPTLPGFVATGTLDTATHTFAARPAWAVDSFGAVAGSATGNDVTNKTAIQAAVTAATAAGQCVTGTGKSYRINGNIVLPNGACLQDIKLVEMGTGVQRPVTSDCSVSMSACAGPFTLRRIRVDRGLSDSPDDSAGIWLTNATAGILMEDVEITGNGAGKGLQLSFSENIKLVRPWVHDMEWTNTSGVDPGIEQITGIVCASCINLEIIDPRVENMWGTIPWVAGQNLAPSQGYPWRTNAGKAYRATAVGGVSGTTAPTCTGTPAVTTCSDGLKTWTYMGPTTTTKRSYQADGTGFSHVDGANVRGGLFQHTWEGIDIGASNNIWLHQVTFKDIDSFGEKWCHNDTNSGSIGTRVIRPGITGVVICGPDPGPIYMSHLRIIDAIVTDPGANGNWAGTHAGYWSGGDVDDVQFINTSVIDTQAVPTISNGYRSDATAAATGAKLINPYTLGGPPYLGIWGGITEVTANGFAVTGTITATASLNTPGFLTTSRRGLTLANGLNSDIPINGTNLSISGVSAPFSLGGFVAQADGTLLHVQNPFVQPMTIVSEDGSSSAFNRIRTNTGANVVLPTQTSSADFLYSSGPNRWLLISTSPLSASTGTSGHAIPYLDTANLWSAQQRMNISAAGAQSVPFAVSNGGGSANTEVAIDLSPTSNGPGIRSGQVASLSATGTGDANLVFRTSNSAAPTERMRIGLGAQFGSGALSDPGLGSARAEIGFQVGVTTVGLLTPCDAARAGMMRGVTDANSATYNAVAVGGGSNKMPVYCNGTAWVLH